MLKIFIFIIILVYATVNRFLLTPDLAVRPDKASLKPPAPVSWIMTSEPHCCHRFKRPTNHEAAGIAALTSAKAACNAASLVDQAKSLVRCRLPI